MAEQKGFCGHLPDHGSTGVLDLMATLESELDLVSKPQLVST